MHKTAGLRDPAEAFPLPARRDDVQERREANRAIAVSGADTLGQQVALQVAQQVPDIGSFTWTARAAPA